MGAVLGQGVRLTLPLAAGGPIDHAEGRKLSEVDWSERSYRAGRYHPPSGRFFLTSDEANDEHLNVYAIDLGDGSIEQITHFLKNEDHPRHEKKPDISIFYSSMPSTIDRM